MQPSQDIKVFSHTTFANIFRMRPTTMEGQLLLDIGGGQRLVASEAIDGQLCLTREAMASGSRGFVRMRFENDGAGRFAMAQEIARHAQLNEWQQRILDEWSGPVQGDLLLPGEPLVTRMRYQYRDGDNHKVGACVAFEGACSSDDVRLLLQLLENVDSEMGHFIPGACGLDDLQNLFGGGMGMWDPERDHPFHEMLSLERLPASTAMNVTAVDGRDFKEFTAAMFQHVDRPGGWDQNYKPSFYPGMHARYEAYCAQEAARDAEAETAAMAPV